MIKQLVIEKKLRFIEMYIEEIKPLKDISLIDFRTDIMKKRFIERNIELAIEQMIDICKQISASLKLKSAETYSQCFEILAQKGVIETSHSNLYVLMVKFRNKLIHIYDEIDDTVTYNIYQSHLGDFELFVQDIKNYINHTV